ncbi:MAG: NAD-dependent epimerase/dehydratase family protein [Hyphomicrobiales bacterium]
MTVLVTGAAGFIGYHLSEKLLDRGEEVIGIDNMNTYYDVRLKEARLARLERRPGFRLFRLEVQDREGVHALVDDNPSITGIIHLAAQAGVRHSLVDPYSYIDANVMGQVVMLEAARRLPNLAHFVYASSSSVYGANTDMPFSIDQRVDRPVSLYAATKRAGELMARSYSHLYGLPTTGLRFFTVYGPWGRPDMAAYLFAEAMRNGRPIHVFNNGDMARDFTYIDDIVTGALGALDHPATVGQDIVPARVYNLGNERTERLLDYIGAIETALGVKAEMIMEPMQAGDVKETSANIDASRRDLGFDPKTPIEVGIPLFIDWYKSYYGIA